MYVLCVAPVRDVDPYRLKADRVFGKSDFDTAFTSRVGESATVTKPRLSEVIASRNDMVDIVAGISDQVRANQTLLYDHVGMHMLVSLIEIKDHAFLRTNVQRFEEMTTQIFEETLCRHYKEEGMREPSIRWVNRTLLLTSEVEDLACSNNDSTIPEHWFQQEPRRPVAFGTDAVFWASWGNNMLAHRATARFDLSSVIDSIIHAQFLWCYVTDIERISLGYLELLSSGKNVKNRLVHGVIDLHFELAMESVMRERTRTEAQPHFRAAVESILEAWGYENVHEDIDRRLQRLEHIVRGRSELMQRTQSKTMELTLFVLGVLTLVSLVISLVQTAFAEVSSDDSGIRPSGLIFEWMRDADATLMVTWSLVISVLIILTVRVWPKAVDQRDRKQGYGIHLQ